MNLKALALDVAKRAASALLGEYSAYFIYQSPRSQPGAVAQFIVRAVEPAELQRSEVGLVRDQAGYMGEEALGFACVEGGRILGLCFYWYGDRYRQRNFWPLAPGQAKLVQIITLPEARGRGVATELIRLSMASVTAAGFTRAYARVWHSNTASYRAFERAGWQRIALVAEVHPLRLAKLWRFAIRLGGSVNS